MSLYTQEGRAAAVLPDDPLSVLIATISMGSFDSDDGPTCDWQASYTALVLLRVSFYYNSYIKDTAACG